MQINNTIFEKRHHYMLIMREAQILRQQIQIDVLDEHLPKIRMTEINKIWNETFIGLLREGLAYQYIKNANYPEKDIVRLTIDSVNYDCEAVTLKQLLQKEYASVLKLDELREEEAEEKQKILHEVEKEKKKETEKELTIRLDPVIPIITSEVLNAPVPEKVPVTVGTESRNNKDDLHTAVEKSVGQIIGDEVVKAEVFDAAPKDKDLEVKQEDTPDNSAEQSHETESMPEDVPEETVPDTAEEIGRAHV